MRRKLWQRLVVWYGLRYDRWPRGWFDASDVTCTSVSYSNQPVVLLYDNWESFPVLPHGGNVTILPDPDFNDEEAEGLEALQRLSAKVWDADD